MEEQMSKDKNKSNFKRFWSEQ